MYKPKFKIYCDVCTYVCEITDPVTFFESSGMICPQCGRKIRPGKQGMDDQLHLYFRNRKPVLQAIGLYRIAFSSSLLEAKNYVEKFAEINNYPLKSQTKSPKEIISFFLLSIFFAFFFSFIFTIVIGLLVPEIQNIAIPIVCHGKSEIIKSSTGTFIASYKVIRISDNGQKTDVSKPIFWVAMCLYACIIFLLFLLMKIYRVLKQ